MPETDVIESRRPDPIKPDPGQAGSNEVIKPSLVIVIKQEQEDGSVTIETNDGTGLQNEVPQRAGGTILLNNLPSTSHETGHPISAAANWEVGRHPFHVDTGRIRAVPESQQNDELQGLGLRVYNQDEFEEDVIAQVDEAIVAEKKGQMEKMLTTELKSVDDDIRLVKQELENINKVVSQITPQISKGNKDALRKLDSVKRSRENKMKQLRKLKAKQKSIKMKLHGGDVEDDMNLDVDDAGADTRALEEALGLAASVRETERERLIRTGVMTPFGSVTAEKPVPKVIRPDESKQLSDFEKYLMDQTKKINSHSKKKVKKSPKSKTGDLPIESAPEDEPKSKKLKPSKSSSIAQPSSSLTGKGQGNMFDAKDKRRYRSSETDFSNYRGKKVHFPRLEHNFMEDRAMSDHEDYEDNGLNEEDRDYVPDERYTVDEEDMNSEDPPTPRKKKQRKASNKVKAKRTSHSDGDWVASGSEDDHDDTSPSKRGKRRASQATHGRDDGTYKAYEKRIKDWRREELKKKHARILAAADGEDVEASEDDEDAELDGGFKVPASIWNKLYKYQRTGVKWLWELHSQQAGGIVGDEMGLGKTIQIIAFLAGLRHSKLKDKGSTTTYYGIGPTLIVCPATIMHQWIKEFHTWAPMFRVAVLHNSGSFTSSPEHLVREIFDSYGVLVTGYSGVLSYQDILLDYDWHYVILDEGHKIRNPDAQITIACKKFRTCHRIILSGSPVQNNLKELWALFDFVFPGKLGTLPDFMAHFSIPIVQGGYSNASQIQVQTAYKCACVLRDTINPYLLRRMKADVKLQLPSRNEQVLFCRLTDEQRDVYKEYLDSKECSMILSGNFMVFPGLITLRKICNHPDLATGGLQVVESNNKELSQEEREYGHWKRAGKMQVVHQLLRLWHKQGHRVLLFTQSRQMLDIMETYIQHQEYTYMRMDGATSIGARQPLINQFNSDPNIFVFLLTTRVGGLGVNLTGANRIIIYDPDWNPSTDTQARERAWRIGQTRQVTIYRLLTAGTIEEKIYHRQIFKQFLTNRVLKDPKQRRFFKSNDLYELFTLTDDNPTSSTETSAIFAGTGSDVRVKVKTKCRTQVKMQQSDKPNMFDKMREEREADEQEEQEIEKEEQEEDNEFGLPPEKLKELREMARKLSQKIGQSKRESEARNSSKVESGTSKDSKLEVKMEVDENEATKVTVISDEDSKSSQDKTGDKLTNGACSPEPSTSGASKKEGKSKHKHSKNINHHKDKKKKKKDAKVDGERIAYLAKNDTYKPPVDKQDDASMNDYVLKQLFKKSGVHSAIQHDKIMMSATPDHALVEAEAERVARQAAKALKQSRSLCNSARSGIPTWTGQNGGTVTSNIKPRFGQKKNTKLLTATGASATVTTAHIQTKPKQPERKVKEKSVMFDGSTAGNMRVRENAASTSDLLSSSELLARMRARNYTLVNAQNEDDSHSDRLPTDIQEEEIDLITDIRNQIAFGCATDGQATTSEILDQFRSRIPAKDSHHFKAMLSQLCDFHKINGQGTWVLKPEFR